MSRELVIAKCCQLIVGSYSGMSRSCPCPTPKYCPLTKKLREKYATFPEVIATKQRNLKEFNFLTAIRNEK